MIKTQTVAAKRPPDVEGPFGKAWRVPQSDKPEHAAGLNAYVVHGPFHPFWSCWLMVVIHLRDLPGVAPAVKHYPEAEYEFAIMSIDPEKHPEVDPDAGPWNLLEPFDVVEQFHGISDERAARILDDAMSCVVQGRMSPDQDFRAIWKETLWNTVKHIQEGRHPEH